MTDGGNSAGGVLPRRRSHSSPCVAVTMFANVNSINDKHLESKQAQGEYSWPQSSIDDSVGIVAVAKG